jgi:hypothetical protein
MPRKYCGRVGGAFDIADGERCPECGYTEHRVVTTCGRFVSCGGCDEGDHDGHPCLLPPGHDGEHNWRGANRSSDEGG